MLRTLRNNEIPMWGFISLNCKSPHLKCWRVKADHSSSSSFEVKNECRYTPALPYIITVYTTKNLPYSKHNSHSSHDVWITQGALDFRAKLRFFSSRYVSSIRGHPGLYPIETGSFSSVVIRLVLFSTYSKSLHDMAANCRQAIIKCTLLSPPVTPYDLHSLTLLFEMRFYKRVCG